MAKVGRPTLYQDSYPELLISIFEQKGGIADFCAKLRICRDTFYVWLESQPEFAHAYGIAKEIAEAWLAQAGIDGMYAGKDFNATVWSMIMRNRCGFTEHRKLPIDLTKAKNADEEMAVVKQELKKGKITASEAKTIADVIAVGSNVHAVTVIDERLKALEDQVKK